MLETIPETRLDQRYSTPGAQATAWDEARQLFEIAQIYWISTVRPDGRPHVTPLIAVWMDESLYFCTGAGERKGKNLAQNAHVVVTTGCNRYGEGLDIVVEGEAVNVVDNAKLRRIAALYDSKYGWKFTVANGGFVGDQENVALVYEVTPETAFGFGKGEPFSQTRWRF